MKTKTPITLFSASSIFNLLQLKMRLVKVPKRSASLFQLSKALYLSAKTTSEYVIHMIFE